MNVRVFCSNNLFLRNMAATAEHDLLFELVSGKKRFEQVAEDVRKLQAWNADLPALTSSNLARSISNRLAEETAISAQTLHFFNVRCINVAALPELEGMQMSIPCILLSTHIKQLVAKDPAYFEVESSLFILVLQHHLLLIKGGIATIH